MQTLKYEYGPITITPGQNTIAIEENTLKPPVDGWITRFKPDLVRADGSVPRVDVIHLHHGVWVSSFKPLFAAGEEKTEFTAPPGFGWRYKTSDRWLMNHMIHNLTPTEEKVYITYELDFIPATSPAAAGIQEIETAWLDVVGGLYPVFDAKRGRYGGDKQFTYPDEDPAAPAQRLARCPRTARSSARAATCTRAASTPTSSSRATGRPCRSSAPRRSTSSRRAPSRGTSR